MIRFHVLKWFSVLFKLKSLYLLASFALKENHFPSGWMAFYFGIVSIFVHCFGHINRCVLSELSDNNANENEVKEQT